jgi:hypothetical protein
MGGFREVGTDPGDLNDCQDMCLATGIGGKIIPESLDIVRVCQDPDNLNIIYMEVILKGVFDYSPRLVVRYRDQLGISQSLDVSDRIILNYKGSATSPSSLPIRTNCGTVELLLAWDIGRSISNYGSLVSFLCDLRMEGIFISHSFDPELLEKIGELFESINPTDTVELIKGVTPQPYALYFDENTGQLKLQYSNLGSGPCYCDIDCVDITAQGQQLEVCENEIQELTIDSNSIVGDPTNVVITFRDSIGNETSLDTQILYNVTPREPGVAYMTNPTHVQVIPFYLTVNSRRIDPKKTQYQIWRYENSEDNVKLLQDWSSKSWSTYFDRDVKSGNLYGYSIRLRGEFKEVSNVSSWATAYVQ